MQRVGRERGGREEEEGRTNLETGKDIDEEIHWLVRGECWRGRKAGIEGCLGRPGHGPHSLFCRGLLAVCYMSYARLPLVSPVNWIGFVCWHAFPTPRVAL